MVTNVRNQQSSIQVSLSDDFQNRLNHSASQRHQRAFAEKPRPTPPQSQFASRPSQSLNTRIGRVLARCRAFATSTGHFSSRCCC